jgi:hypothetical protein
VRVSFRSSPIETATTDALLVPLDERGEICGAGARAAMRIGLAADLDPDERRDALEEIAEHVRERARSLGGFGSALAIEGEPPFRTWILARAMAHSTSERSWSADEHARILRDAIRASVQAASRAGAASLAMTLLGTQYRVTPELAAKVLADALAAEAATRLDVHVHAIDAEHLAAAEAAWRATGH